MKTLILWVAAMLASLSLAAAQDFKIGQEYRVIGKFKEFDKSGNMLIELKGMEAMPFSLPSETAFSKHDIKSWKQGMLFDVNFQQKSNEKLIKDIQRKGRLDVPPPEPIVWPGLPPTTNSNKSFPAVRPMVK